MVDSNSTFHQTATVNDENLNVDVGPSDRQMQPQGYMYPRLGTPAVECRGIKAPSNKG